MNNEFNTATLRIKGYRGPESHVELETNGSKNCALPVIMYSFLMHDGQEVELSNIPALTDVYATLDAFRELGGEFDYDPRSQKLFITTGIRTNTVPPSFVQKTRIAVVLMSVLIAKFGYVKFPKETGGCNLGDRKYDYHLQAFKDMGYEHVETDDFHYINAGTNTDGHKTVNFPKETTTGTENALFLASFRRGITVIKGAHLRPEILEVIRYMNCMGANVSVQGDTITVSPSNHILKGKVEFRIIDDLEEALSKIILATAVSAAGTIRFDNPYHYAELDVMREIYNGKIEVNDSLISFTPDNDRQKIPSYSITTGAYPGIGSDAQPILAGQLLSSADSFTITETRFSGRFAYAEYLCKFGVATSVDGDVMSVDMTTDIPALSEDVDLVCHDLRAAICAVIFSARFKSTSTIREAQILFRGYSDITEVLDQLGIQFDIEWS